MQPVATAYREFMPCEGLRDHVRSLFSFIPGNERVPSQRPIACEVLFRPDDLICPPMLADGNTSLVFDLGRICLMDGRWQSDPSGCHGKVIGALRRGDGVCIERAAMVGAYFHAGQTFSFIQVPARELTDRILPLEDVWGAASLELPTELAEMDEAARINKLESVLLHRIRNNSPSHSAVDLPRLAASIVQKRGNVTIESLTTGAGISRQHLARLFSEGVGISPKLFCRLARFQSGLAYAGRGKDVDWAQAARALGYSDQSHMIGEFREFSSLTPQMLAQRPWFHPFIERARLSRTSGKGIARRED